VATHREGVDLPPLWLPLTPSTENIGRDFANVGAMAKTAFDRGFSATDFGGAQGKTFANKFIGSFQGAFKNADFGAMTTAMDKLGEQVDARLASKLKASMPALRQEYEKTTAEMYKMREALHQVQVADDQAVASGRGTIQMLRERRRLEAEYEGAGKKAVAAQKEYNATLNEYTEASAKVNTASTLMGGIMGGALVLGVQGVISGFEGVVHLGEHLFDDAIEGAEEFGEKLLELGGKFETINHQIVEFSGASGDALTELQEHAAKVLAGLDVAGKDVGKTMAVLSSRLHTGGASEELDKLTGTLTELQGRYSDLKADDVATVFTDWGMGIDQAGAALDTLVQNSQQAGASVGAVSAEMKGPLSETLQAVGLNFGQATHVAALLAAQGIPTSDAVRGLGTSMKTFAAHGLSFTQGIAEARKELSEIHDPVQRDQLAMELFGTKFIDAQHIMDAFNQTLGESPDAFDGAAGAAQALNDATQGLDEKVQALKNRMEGMFKPMAESAVDVTTHGLSLISSWFEGHKDQIIGDIQSWGDKFIDMIPEIKHFVASAIDMLGPFTDMLASMGSVALETAAAFAAMTLHFGDAEEFMKAAGALQHAAGGDTPFGQLGGGGPIDKFFGKIKDQVEGLDTSNQALSGFKESLQDTTDAMRGMRPGFNSWFSPNGGSGAAPPGYSGGGGGYGGAPGGGPKSAGPLPAPAAPAPPAAPAAPGAPAPAPQHHTGVTQGKQPAPGHGGNAFAPSGNRTPNWQGIAQAESSGNWQITYGEGDDVTGGLQIATATWLSHGGGKYAPKAYMATPDQQIEVATAILNDPNQGPKAWPTTYRDHPEYFSQGGSAQASGNGLSKLLAKFGFGPKGKDTVLSWYTPGEFVVTPETMDKYGPLIRALQGKGRYFAGGGTGSADAYASNPGGDDTQGVDAEILGADAVAHGFGLRLTAGKSGHGTHDVDGGYHDSGMAGDFSNGVGTPQEAAFAMYMAQNYAGQIAELIHYGPGWDANYNIKDGKFIRDYGGVPKVYDMGTLNGHQDHVHVAMKPGSAPSLEAMGSGTTAMSGGSGWAGASATPAGWGGGGGSGGSGASAGGGFAGAPFGPGNPPPGGVDVPVLPGEDWNEWIARSQRIGSARKHQADLEDEHTKKLQDRAKIQDQLNADDQAVLFHKMPADKRKDLEDKRDEADKDISRIEQEQAKAQGDEQIDAYKAGEPRRGGKSSSMDSAAHSLGGSFLSGIGQELGFGDLFGKAPWDFGIVKTLGGAAQYGMSLFDAFNGGGRGGGATQGIGQNIFNGAAGATGFPAPFGPSAPNLTMTPGAQAPGTLPTAPGLPYAAPVIGGAPTAPGRAPGPATAPGPGQTPGPKPGAPGTPQTPAGAPGSGVPGVQTPGLADHPTPSWAHPADFNSGSDKNYGNRYAAGFDDGHGGKTAAPQGAPWASAVDSLTTMALSYASKAIPSVSGKGGGFQMPGTGGGSGGDSGGQGQPLGATGIMQTTGSVPTFYGGGGGDTHNHNYGDNINHIDNSRTWNVTPKNDAGMVQHLQNHDNTIRSNAALASAPGSLQSYP
jgi:hypothetical protein